MKFQLPEPPQHPIGVQDRYDKFYRKQLLCALREDYESFPEGMTTYRAHILRVIESYAADIADPNALSVKDLQNFLKGMNSHIPKIKVLDAFMQIVNSKRARGFRIDNYQKYIGEAFVEYLGHPYLHKDYGGRSQITKQIEGIYEIEWLDGQSAELEHDDFSRILVLRASASSSHLFAYEFSYPISLLQMGSFNIHQEHLRLATGICIPHPFTSFLIMRDYRFLANRVGKLEMNWSAEEQALGKYGIVTDSGGAFTFFACGINPKDFEPLINQSQRYESIFKYKINEITDSAVKKEIIIKIDQLWGVMQ